MKTDFETFKQSSIENQPVFYDTALKNVEVADLDVFTVEGTPLNVTPQARNELHDILNVPNSFANHVENTLGRDARLGIVDSLRSAISEKNGIKVKLSLANDKIVGINRDFRTVKMEGFFELFEMFMNRYDLDVTKYSNGFGMSEITAKSPRQVNIDGKNLPDEVFNTGVTFRCKNGKVSVNPYIFRLVCTNGMIGRYEENQQLSSTQKDVVAGFFKNMDKLAEQSFMPDGLRNHVLRAISTRASVDEVFKARELIDSYSVTKFTNPLVESFVPAEEIKDAYAKNGYDVNEMSITQRKSCMTNLRYWDVINGLTRFASHDYTSDGFKISEREQMDLQQQAGLLLQRKTIDCENRIPTPPQFSSAMLN